LVLFTDPINCRDPKVPQVLLAGQELVGNLVRMASQVTGVLMEHLWVSVYSYICVI